MREKLKYYQKKLDEAKLAELNKRLQEYINYRGKNRQ